MVEHPWEDHFPRKVKWLARFIIKLWSGLANAVRTPIRREALAVNRFMQNGVDRVGLEVLLRQHIVQELITKLWFAVHFNQRAF